MASKEKGLKGAMLTGLKKAQAPVTDSANEEVIEEKRTFSLPTTLLEKMELEAFWDRKTQKEIIVELLTEHYRKKTYDPLPSTYRKPKTGRPRKR